MNNAQIHRGAERTECNCKMYRRITSGVALLLTVENIGRLSLFRSYLGDTAVKMTLLPKFASNSSISANQHDFVLIIKKTILHQININIIAIKIQGQSKIIKIIQFLNYFIT